MSCSECEIVLYKLEIKIQQCSKSQHLKLANDKLKARVVFIVGVIYCFLSWNLKSPKSN